MINLLQIHNTFQNTKRNNLIIFTITIMSIIVIGFLSKIGTPYHEVSFFSDSYYDSFMFQSYTYVKTMIVVIILFVVINNFIVNKYDMFLYTRFEHRKVFVSKILVSLYTVIIVVLLLNMAILAFSYLNKYIVDLNIFISNFIGIIIITIYYFMLSLLLHQIVGNIFIQITPLIGYIVSSMSLDYGVNIDELSTFTKLIHVLFPDFIVLNGSYTFIYGSWVVLSCSLLYLVLILKFFNCNDL